MVNIYRLRTGSTQHIGEMEDADMREDELEIISSMFLDDFEKLEEFYFKVKLDIEEGDDR